MRTKFLAIPGRPSTVAVVCGMSWLLASMFVVNGSVRAQRPQGPPTDFQPVKFDEDQITLSLFAPQADAVQLSSSDLPGVGRGQALEKSDAGVWSVTVARPRGGAYRYVYEINGVRVTDPANLLTSQSNTAMWSLLEVPGAEWDAVPTQPHGTIAEVHYYSESLARDRRMHVYLPPGYSDVSEPLPVFYLLHGASDGDDSWSTVGQAALIMDHLINTGKAKPMVVVMPHGHTAGFEFGRTPNNNFQRQMGEFETDFAGSLRPAVEQRFNVRTDKDGRALAGLSMGGAQTLNIGFAKLADYGYLGVFSSGVFGIAGGFGNDRPSSTWVDDHSEILKDESIKQDPPLIWFATGREDFLLSTTEATVAMLKEHEFDVQYKETDGGHTWLNWRDYLMEFAPLLFQ